MDDFAINVCRADVIEELAMMVARGHLPLEQYRSIAKTVEPEVREKYECALIEALDRYEKQVMEDFDNTVSAIIDRAKREIKLVRLQERI